jgi:hypothetical protein
MPPSKFFNKNVNAILFLYFFDFENTGNVFMYVRRERFVSEKKYNAFQPILRVQNFCAKGVKNYVVLLLFRNSGMKIRPFFPYKFTLSSLKL